MNVHAHITLVVQNRLTGMAGLSAPESAAVERRYGIAASGRRLRRPCEGVEKSVALSIHLTTRCERSPDSATMVGQGCGVPLSAELVQQPCEPSMSVNTNVTVPAGRSTTTLEVSRPLTYLPTPHHWQRARLAGVQHVRLGQCSGMTSETGACSFRE
jgi:hypothetical protein